MTAGDAVLQTIRQRFHPLHTVRGSAIGRAMLRVVDRPSWIRLPRIGFRVRGQFISHGLAYGLAARELFPEALALASLERFRFRSFWDVGANFGFYSWLLKSASPDLDIVLVEPLRANTKLIRETIRRNRLSDVRLIEAGASDATGEGILQADTLSGATSSLVDKPTFEQAQFGVAPQQIRIPLITIDGACHSQVDFIKIDVEGHEAAALRGAAETIRRDQPVLFIECVHYPEHLCLSTLSTAGYRIVDADCLSDNWSNTLSFNFFCFPPRYSDAVDGVLDRAKEKAGAKKRLIPAR